MVAISGFSQLIASTPKVNEAAHFLASRLVEASLGQQRAIVDAGRSSSPINRGVEGFLGGFVDKVV